MYAQPGTWNLRMFLTFADNMILIQGDCYSMLFEPGYGRNGLAFLRGSIKSTGYFLEKCPFRKELVEYSYDKAVENIKDYFIEDSEKGKQMLDELSDEFTEEKYYDLCYEYDIDEPSPPTELTATAKMQLAGLECFVEEYNSMQEVLVKPRVLDETDMQLTNGPM